MRWVQLCQPTLWTGPAVDGIKNLQPQCPLSTQSGLMQRNKKPRFGGVLVVRTYTKRYPFGRCSFRIAGRIFRSAKSKPAQRQGRNATGPRFQWI